MSGRLLATLVGAALLAGGCASPPNNASPPRMIVAGTVRDHVVTVRAPGLRIPAFDPVAGLPDTRTPPTAAGPAPGVSGPPAVSGLLVSADVVAGARVRAGTIVARLDDRALRLGVVIARAAAARSRAEADALEALLADLELRADDLSAARRIALDTIEEAEVGRRALRARIAETERAASAMSSSGSSAAGATDLGGASRAASPDPRALLRRLQGELASVEAGLARARTALAKLDSSAATLEDARAAAESGRAVLRATATAAGTAVPVAEARLSQAAIVAPYEGVVTWIAEPGTVLMVGGPVVRIRRTGPAVVDTYLTGDQMPLLRVGSPVRVTADWLDGETLKGRVTEVRRLSEYPPTEHPSGEIHLLRAFRVSVTLDDTSARMPPGTPADLEIPVG